MSQSLLEIAGKIVDGVFFLSFEVSELIIVSYKL